MFITKEEVLPVTIRAKETSREIPEAKFRPSSCALTKHALLRLAQRNLSADQLSYVFRNADHFVDRAGASFLILLDKDIPPEDRRNDGCAKLGGTVIVLAPDGAVITVYRHPKAYRRIRTKGKYDRYLFVKGYHCPSSSSPERVGQQNKN